MVNQDLLTRNIIHNLLGSFIDNVNSINAIEIAKSRNIKISTLQNDFKCGSRLYDYEYLNDCNSNFYEYDAWF